MDRRREVNMLTWIVSLFLGADVGVRIDPDG
jgi:hypothetical protein